MQAAIAKGSIYCIRTGGLLDWVDDWYVINLFDEIGGHRIVWVLWKWSKANKIKRMLFNRMKQDKTCTFLRKSSFSSYIQHKNKQFNLPFVSWMLEKEDFLKKNVHILSCFVQLKSVTVISCVLWIFFSQRWQSALFQIFFLSKWNIILLVN